MAVCVRCNTTLSFLEQMSRVGQTKMCSTCTSQVAGTLQRLQQQVMHLASQNAVTKDFSDYVYRELHNNRVSLDQAQALIQLLRNQQTVSTIQRLRQQVMHAAAQNGLTKEFSDYVYRELSDNRVPPEQANALLQELSNQRYLYDIRMGHLPTVQVHTILDTDEKAHLETIATYYKPNKQIRFVQGRIIATNKKLYFITPDRDSMTIDWNNVVGVHERPGTTPQGQLATLMHIQVSKGSGGGMYYVPDPALSVTIIDTAVRLWKRHLVELKANPNTRGIPDHVRTAVFQRDGGRCVQCGYEGPYIEYDHILPRSKGGQNTVENVQLLCGQCNRKKGNRI
ncbi:MAG TPA: HNH endonuclease [Ktedonobacteraceae bacterium]|nr:HNH endonuclease [Ktedonobacteraceae bacterium]